MRPEDERDDEPKASSDPEPPPLEPGRPMTLEESVERMYARFDKTFEALAK